MFLWRLGINVVIFFVLVYAENSPYAVPNVKFEALKTGGFRAYIPDLPVTTLFALHANINDQISPQAAGDVSAETKKPINGHWILEFDNKLKVGDQVYYWVFVNANNLGYRKDNVKWQVIELVDQYSKLQGTCVKGSTVINGGKSTCIGNEIIHDEFKEALVNTNIWTIEHRIPINVGPNYEFNSYEDRDETRFFSGEKLLLKPLALTTDNDVRGILDLRSKCTADQNMECFYEQKSVFFLPPVKSAKISSKISFKYGKVEIRARLPAGDWIVPVMQLEAKVPDKVNLPRIWIAYSRGNNYLTPTAPLDIDVRGNNDVGDIGSRMLFAGPIVYSAEPERSKKLVTKYSNVPFNADFHTYGLEWTEDKMTFSLDSTIYGTVDLNQNFAIPKLNIGSNWKTNGAPFNEEFILTLGVAVGGHHEFPDGYYSGSNPKPWDSAHRTYLKEFFNARDKWLSTWIDDKIALEIDYVKVTAV